MRGVFTLGSFISVVFFPWICTILVTFVAAFFEPLVPVAVGIFADTLYYTPTAAVVPLYTILGALLTIIALFVRTRLWTGTLSE